MYLLVDCLNCAVDLSNGVLVLVGGDQVNVVGNFRFIRLKLRRSKLKLKCKYKCEFLVRSTIAFPSE